MVQTRRLATPDDLPAIAALMGRAMAVLQAAFLTPEQVAASAASMGLDTQLIADRTYFLIEEDGALVGCGGWGKRATLYGGDHAALRDDTLLDPATDAARIRAMYTDPAHARRGIGRTILSLCEDAARAAGFRSIEMMATRSGEPLYTACGYAVVERVERMAPTGVAVPGAVMRKAL
ncbi:GNAT family N-acetyltransferase [Sphingomonas sp.]|jgi:GNAT superfamily N-acetyltransferase|uniref:GNAT family N-acetyltransferase n=1 Tax=Sphingomonas sp. TaxID=28214 RepID=UPI002D806BC8|nr:GNAT family N-acetyltransferase [Sphingomonas sp.]HEU0044621.1 GNAT family N-acetyltransferase [Sphingomonas sp.]